LLYPILHTNNTFILLDAGLIAPHKFKHQISIIKGDRKEPIIGMASIVAKVTRDSYMVKKAQEYSHYALEHNKGYGTLAHLQAIKKHGHRAVEYIAQKDEISGRIMEIAEGDDMVITLGAGDVWQVGEQLVEALEEKHGTTSLRLVTGEDGQGA